MADSKLSALTAATPAGPDLVYLVQGGNPRRGTAQGIANLATKATVGLGNADNTSDANKPISTATQTALDGKVPLGGALGTPSSGTLTNATGLPLANGVTGLLPVANGGTGTPTPSLVAGANVTITGSWPNQTIAAAGGGGGGGGHGTVTSVGLSVPTGLAVAGSPITTSGTLALSFAAGYSLPLTATQASWDAGAVLAGTAVQPAGLASTLTGYVQTSDARLGDSREWSATTITQAEAEAGSATTRRAFTAQRVFQSIAGYIAANFSAVGQALATAANAAAARTAIGAGTDVDVYKVPIGDEGTAITAGTNKVRFKADFAGTLVAVRAGVNTAPTGSTLIVDINKNGVSMLGTKLSIDATETSSTTAASAATITTTSIADDDEISIDIDQIGSTVAGAGLKVSLFVRRA